MSPDPIPPLLELRDVTFGYAERPVLDKLSLHIPRGKVTALVGPMGGRQDHHAAGDGGAASGVVRPGAV